MPPTPDDAELKAIFNALRKFIRAARLSSHEVQTSVGISGSQLFVLQRISERPHLSLTELAKLTLTDHSSVSVVVARLVRKRLVARRTSAKDARRVEVALTPKGRALLKGRPEVVQERLLRSLNRLSKRDLRTLRGLLERVVSDLGFAREPAEMFFEVLK